MGTERRGAAEAAKYRGADSRRTIVGRMGRMTKRESEHADPARLRKETREWLATRTIPNVREVARDLENAGEDVHDLVAAIDELESLVRGARTKPRKRAVAKSHA